MEKCQRKVNSYSVTRSVYLMGLFDWKMVKEEKNGGAIPVPDYVDTNVSDKVVKIIQSYVGVVNKMVWRKEV